MPDLDVGMTGREVLAVWSIEGMAADNGFLIDSNGLEILEKAVIPFDEIVEKHFYPVNTMIALKNEDNETFMIKNDRPQAGTIREDKNSSNLNHIELLIDRRLKSQDSYGIVEVMAKSVGLEINFKISLSKDINVLNTQQRMRDLQVFKGDYNDDEARGSIVQKNFITERDNLVEYLQASGVS